ncbi:L-threonylcarbamoyladenylate synthase [Allosphingosinicella indica]|uniref:Threonylcarbamoyl-AMP synthase n=1 Tax=Allosphingosinicella indica TaxID=941907 RepID=A0A1X7GKA5_9SPHN|nr:L-threonylcarbamoyladenylate synthase [Allosphingosinicella indica]SMF70338.1 translation factor SUA5 [Allosphingosinicella indica]
MSAPNPPGTAPIRPYGEAAIAEAAALVAAGQPVAIPTETVYGLAADATNGAAVARVYAAKRRPSFNPLIVHVGDLEAAGRIAKLDDAARALGARFWPGPLTMVLPTLASSGIAPLVTAGLDTVAIRVPQARAIRALIAATGKPLAAPSANASGSISPTRAEHVAASLGERIALILDDGPSAHGIESTIVAVEAGQLRLLRPGPIGIDALEEAGGLPVVLAGGGRIEAPGQLASHYAPSKPLRLDAVQGESGEWLIGFGAVAGRANLSPSGDLVEAAANLFAALHEADASRAPAIAVAPIPDEGLGAAINDRLRRAAAPRL